MKYIYITVLLLLSSCKVQEITPLNYTGDMIIVGNGGGFTGISTSFYLMPDGNIFRSGMSDSSFVNIGRISTNQMDQQFALYEHLDFAHIDLNDPGNRYHFIIKKTDGKEHKIQWGRSKLENPYLGIYHDNIMKMIKTLSQKPNK